MCRWRTKWRNSRTLAHWLNAGISERGVFQLLTLDCLLLLADTVGLHLQLAEPAHRSWS